MENTRQLASETGLFTYEVFEVLLNYEIARLKRYPAPITLIHVALDIENLAPHLKKRALEAMSNLLNHSLRSSDVPAHYNDEFLVLLPSANEEAARSVAERILGQFRVTHSLSTGKLSNRRNVYLGLTTQAGGAILSDKQLLAEAAVAMNEARLRQSYTFVAFADIGKGLPKL